MIKKIQLRGISRAPSDRMTEDGGCSESLNLQLDNGETSPAPVPKDVSTSVYGSGSSNKPIYFIHKLPGGGEVYIGVENNLGSSSLVAYKNGSSLTITSGPTLSSAADFKFSSIGNILILYSVLYSASTTYFFVYRNGGYTYLGNEIPAPAIDILSHQSGNEIITVDIANGELQRMGGNNPSDSKTVAEMSQMWNSAKMPGSANHAEMLATMQNIWDAVSLGISAKREGGYFVAPFFIRYALRLYDGKYIHASAPILCGGRASDGWLKILLKIGGAVSGSAHKYFWTNGVGYDDNDNIIDDGTGYYGYRIKATLNNIFKVYVKGSYDASVWGDMVQSIDIFASSPAYTPELNGVFGETVADTVNNNVNLFISGAEAGTIQRTTKEELLSKGQYYLIKSISLTDDAEMTKLGNGTMVIENGDSISGDGLYTHKELKGVYRDSSYVARNDVLAYNNRQLLCGVYETLPRGEAYLNGQVARSSDTSLSLPRYAFRYKVVDDNGVAHYVVARYHSGQNKFIPAYRGVATTTKTYHGDDSSSGLSAFYASKPYAWLAFPDTRCTEVEIYYYNSGGTFIKGKVVPMQPHPYLECAYAYFGLGVTLDDISVEDSYPTLASDSGLSSESRTITSPNKAVMTEFQNPFIFPAGGILTFNDEVIGAATTTVPLSEGQLGQFPLYIFTQGGIRTLTIKSDGSVSNVEVPPDVARHVAVKGSILGLDQSVVFTTNRGVMLLGGMTVKCISEVMNGRHGTVDASIRSLLSGWGGYSTIGTAVVQDSTTFMGFMGSGVSPIYDHSGSRLIFAKEGKSYCYVYMIKTGSWHKITAPANVLYRLNSFPGCLVAAGNGGVYDFATDLTDYTLMADNATARYCFLETRPFDLGEPDVRKKISHIRIRGRFNRKDVRYILLGSMDNINWYVLRSLHGNSYKMFRMVIVATLSPTERISWIDVDYETRYTNRLR